MKYSLPDGTGINLPEAKGACEHFLDPPVPPLSCPNKNPIRVQNSCAASSHHTPSIYALVCLMQKYLLLQP